MTKKNNPSNELLAEIGIPTISDANRVGEYEKEFEELGEAIGKRFYLGHKGTIHTRYLKVSEKVIEEIRELQYKLAEANKTILNIKGIELYVDE